MNPLNTETDKQTHRERSRALMRMMIMIIGVYHTHTHTHRVLEMVLMRMLGCRKTLKIEKWRQEELHGFLEAQKRNI